MKFELDTCKLLRGFLCDDDQEMTDIAVTQGMLKSKINKLKEDKSPGDDGITPKFLKNVVDELEQPLKYSTGV